MNRPSTRFSVIIPTAGNSACLEDTLASVLRNLPQDCEAILVHDGSFEDQYDIASEMMIVDAGSRRLGAQVDSAMQYSKGEYIAIVRPAVELNDRWDSIVESQFSDEKTGSVSPLLVSPSRKDRLVAAGVATNYRFARTLVAPGKTLARRVLSRIRPAGPTSWAAFYRASSLAMIGCLEQRVEDSYFDLDLALSLGRLGFHNTVAQECVCEISSPAEFNKEARRPHGQSAQRSIARHSPESGFGRAAFSFASEIVSALFKPGAFQQAVGRFSASRFCEDDREFNERLQAVIRQNSAMEKAGLRVATPPIGDQVTPTAQRRAA